MEFLKGLRILRASAILQPAPTITNGLVQYGEQPVYEALEKSHEELFERLLETPLAQQENDLRAFWHSRSSGNDFQLKFFEDTILSWIPAQAPTYLKDLFCSNLRALRELLQDDKPTAR
jgi:hypothetical protein